MNEKSDGCSGNHYEVTCELDPYECKDYINCTTP